MTNKENQTGSYEEVIKKLDDLIERVKARSRGEEIPKDEERDMKTPHITPDAIGGCSTCYCCEAASVSLEEKPEEKKNPENERLTVEEMVKQHCGFTPVKSLTEDIISSSWKAVRPIFNHRGGNFSKTRDEVIQTLLHKLICFEEYSETGKLDLDKDRPFNLIDAFNRINTRAEEVQTDNGESFYSYEGTMKFIDITGEHNTVDIKTVQLQIVRSISKIINLNIEMNKEGSFYAVLNLRFLRGLLSCFSHGFEPHNRSYFYDQQAAGYRGFCQVGFSESTDNKFKDYVDVYIATDIVKSYIADAIFDANDYIVHILNEYMEKDPKTLFSKHGHFSYKPNALILDKFLGKLDGTINIHPRAEGKIKLYNVMDYLLTVVRELKQDHSRFRAYDHFVESYVILDVISKVEAALRERSRRGMGGNK